MSLEIDRVEKAFDAATATEKLQTNPASKYVLKAINNYRYRRIQDPVKHL